MRLLILPVLVLLLSINSEVSANPDAFQQARQLYNQARFAEAIRIYQEIIEADPYNTDAYLNLAYLYKDLAEYKQAIKIIRQAQELSQDFKFQMLLARLYYLEGRPQQAILQLEELLPFYSEDPQVLLYLGLSYQDAGKFTEAQAFYSNLVRLKPDSTLAYLKLADIYYRTEMFKKAAQTFQKIVALDPSIPGVRPKLAGCFTRLGEFKQAYNQYAKCVAIDPEDKLLRQRLDETKTKLGKDFLEQKRASALQRRRAKLIRVKPSAFAENAPSVRIGITAEIKGSVEFKTGAPFELIDKQNGNTFFEGSKDVVYSLVFDKKAHTRNKNSGLQASVRLKDDKGNVLLEGLDKPFLIKNKSQDSVISIFDIPVGRGNFWAGWDDQQYRGRIEVVPDNHGFQLINLVNLEEYLYGVLPSEMPVNWPKQALCAQAIAARTWAMKNMARHRRGGFNFCNSVHCQVYKGAGEERQSTNQAVDQTAGFILVSDNQPIAIFYSNNCGGCTRDGIVDSPSLDFHRSPSPLELETWFKTEPDTFCNLQGARTANFRWQRLYTQGQLQAMLDKSGIRIGELIKIIPQMRAGSSHLTSIKIQGSESSQIVEGEHNIRKMLGNLLSSAFKIETKFNQENRPVEFIFYGGGFGHGRGLCQSGVKGMGLADYDYLEILGHYYPDAQVKKIY